MTKLTQRDSAVLDRVLEAAKSPCPTIDHPYYNVEGCPHEVDNLVAVLQEPEVRGVLLRLLKPEEAFSGMHEFWRGLCLGEGYEVQRERCIARVRELRSTLPETLSRNLNAVEMDILACLRQSRGRDVAVADLRVAAGLHGENGARTQRRSCAELMRRGLARSPRKGHWRASD